ncbi:M16 family metallopeptidase [Cerasicoccus fimbriatus]|uniref:M16 family metallopeptidase n=1 Tax=Cerasicoccus fimbriatus TaxID=3014554 RepID=UPI0022B2E7EC|nr:M16 family metallopeptidase [Cerasicoccus sp. TK19100]
MRFVSKPFLSLLLCLPLVCAIAQAKDSASPGLPADSSVTFGALDNGLHYAIMPNNEPPGRVSLRLLVEAGSLQEAESQRGVAHFLEHMAFNGSEHYPPGELIEYLQRLGMSFGADTNAHTGFDETVYKLELPENNPELFHEGMQVLRDYAGGLLLREQEIEQERGVILSEKRDRDSVGYRTFVAYWEFLFPEARMPERLPIGLEEVIKNAPRDEFVSFYQTWYRPENMAVIIVGDVDVAKTEATIKDMFANMKNPDAPMPEIDMGALTRPQLATKLHSEPEAPSTEVSLMTLREYHGEPDSREVRVRDMITAAANRIVTRRLEILAKQEGAPFTTGNAFFWDYLDFFEIGGIELTCKPEQWQDAVAVIEQELRRALEFGFTEAEVAEVKAKIINDYEEAVKAAPTRKSRDLSASIVSSMSRDYVFTSPETDLSIAQEAMAQLTPDSAQAAFDKVWDGGGRFLFVSGNLELENGDAELAKAFTASAATGVTAPEVGEALTWPYTNFGEPGKVVEKKFIEDLGIWQVTFENNVRFNFKQTDFEANSVSVVARFGGGELAMSADQKGIATFANMAFSAGGLEALSVDEMERVLAGQSVGGSFSVGEEFFTLAGGTTPKDLERELELLAAYLTAPGYREEAARQARKAYDEMAIQVERTVEGVWGNQVAKYIAGDNFRFGFPSESDFASQSMDKLKAWLTPALTSAYLEVSIVGDVDFETALPLVQKTVGALPQRSAEQDLYKSERKGVAFPQETQEQVFTFESDIPRALASVYWPTTDFWDIKRTRRLNVLASIFRDRLRLEVREKLGEGYSPYARNSSSEIYDDYGYMFGLNFADPNKVETVVSIIRDLGVNLGEGNITEDELQRAVLPMQKYVEEYVRKNSYWLQRVLAGSTVYPQQLDWARTLASDYEAITLDEVNGLAKEYLGAGPGLPIVIKPADKPE